MKSSNENPHSNDYIDSHFNDIFRYLNMISPSRRIPSDVRSVIFNKLLSVVYELEEYISLL